MKRINNIYSQICSIGNLIKADKIARKGKSKQDAILQHDKTRGCNLILLSEMLSTKTYKTSEYTTFKIFEPKERVIFRLPYYPDRIAHHAIMAVLEPVFMAAFTADTYSCIKGRGIHGAFRNLRKALKDVPETQYCLKMDIRKFYPSIDHEVLKSLLRRKFKDADLLWLLDEIIDSSPGLPIGNYLSQYLANFYLTYFDHWLKEELKVKYYFRYADDIVVLAGTKEQLHEIRGKICLYLENELKLEVKQNYQVFPVASRGIDFVGYVFYHTHTLLRKSIKQNFARKLAKNAPAASIAAYKGWTNSCNSTHLLKTLNEKVQRIRNSKKYRAEPYRRQNTDRKYFK